MIRLFFISYIFFFTLKYQAQTASENWIPVSIEKDISLFINVTGISNYSLEDLYIWSLQEMDPPMSMEEIHGDIYKIRTYYHINGEMNRYSIIQIVFYDSRNNVLKQYSYEHKSDKPEFKFSYPIIRNSEVDKILTKCLEYISSTAEKK